MELYLHLSTSMNPVILKFIKSSDNTQTHFTANTFKLFLG